MTDETKERILVAALDVFSEKGYAAAGTKTIASAAGVNEVTLFRCFGSKRDLYLAVFRRFSVSPNRDTIMADIAGDFRRDVLALADSVVSLFISNDKIVRMSIKDMESFPEINSELKGQPELLISLVGEYFRRASESIRLVDAPEKLARIFVASLMGTTLHLLRFSDEGNVRSFAADFTAIFSRGMIADR